MNGIDLMVSFDTTGSMYPCLAQVRRNLKDLTDKLFSKIPNLRMGVIAHGDYCDVNSSYVIKMLDLTDNKNKIMDFIQTVSPTHGGDAEECYELVLHEARSATWTAEKSRVLLMIGDDLPHSHLYRENKQKIDWVNEAKMLSESNIKIYSVQCLNNSYANKFWNKIAEISNGLRLALDQFKHIETLLLGVAYKQEGEEVYQQFEKEQMECGICRNLRDIFDKLSGRKETVYESRSDSLIPVPMGRFQSFSVSGHPSISEFVKDMGIIFKVGRGFYPHITRTEKISPKKELILEDLSTGEFFTGSQVRNILKISHDENVNLRPNPHPGFRVWVQSTSHNRILREEAFLYEVV